jgi:hemoglobin/transferrin/lactoferrin receptor protein
MANITENTNLNDGKPFAPEESAQIEAGLHYRRHGLWLADDRFHAEFLGFETRLRNTIERVGGGGGEVAKIWSNPDIVEVRGIEVRSGWGVGNFNTSVGFSLVDVEVNGEAADTVRRKTSSSGSRIVLDSRWWPFDQLTLGHTMTAVFRLTDVAGGSDERPGYVPHDLQAQWQPRLFPNCTLSLAIRNLFDHRYSDQASLVSASTGILHEPGRDVRMALSYRF